MYKWVLKIKRKIYFRKKKIKRLKWKRTNEKFLRILKAVKEGFREKGLSDYFLETYVVSLLREKN